MITIQAENVNELRTILLEMCGATEKMEAKEPKPVAVTKKKEPKPVTATKKKEPKPVATEKEGVKKEETEPPTPEAILETAKSLLQKTPGLKTKLKSWLEELGFAKLSELDAPGRIEVSKRLEAL